MSKDPAFLFYSKEFYEGTRTMLPEERACYIDLLIYQHQHGIIPFDLRRVLLYCNGIALATLEATLEAKFKKTDKGWLNLRLELAVFDRENFKNKQSENGKIGQFWKKTKQILTENEFKSLQKTNISRQQIVDFIEVNEINELTLKALLKRCLSNNVNVNVNVNVNEEENEIELKKAKSEKIDFEEIKNIFNSHCTNLPSVQKLSKSREAAIRSRIKEHGMESMGIVFQNTADSNFLNGENQNGWKADFDWILKPNNFIKILEGNYKNKTPIKKEEENKIGRMTETNYNKAITGW